VREKEREQNFEETLLSHHRTGRGKATALPSQGKKGRPQEDGVPSGETSVIVLYSLATKGSSMRKSGGEKVPRAREEGYRD